jgi:hypothetical protein
VTESSNPDVLARAIKTLTVAVWCLCGLMVLQLGFYGWSYFQSMRWARQATTTSFTSRSSSSKTPRPEPIDEKPFHEMPPEEMVARSSVILLTSYQDDGNRNKAVVAEILKQDPDVTLYYSVGDEYPMLSFEKQKDMTCGDGNVVFMAGSPASMRSSYSFTNGRIGGLGDMPLAKLRVMIKQNEMAKQKKS